MFMFHGLFLTKVDQAVKVQCFYMEADKTVDAPLEVRWAWLFPIIHVWEDVPFNDEFSKSTTRTIIMVGLCLMIIKQVDQFTVSFSNFILILNPFSMITTEFRDNQYLMPTCRYSIRSQAPDGPIIKFAAIGQKVFHRWECVEQGEIYFAQSIPNCLRVFLSCFVRIC